MELTRFTFIGLVLVASMCRSEIVIESTKLGKSMARFADDVINIVTSCHEGPIKGVGLAGHFSKKLSRTLSVQHSIPVVLINKSKLKFEWPSISKHFRQKLSVFIIQPSSEDNLSAILKNNLKRSIWFDYTSSFFILDLSRGCDNGQSYLRTCWNHRAMNAKVICYRHERGRIILNYNPFTSQAPISWQQLSVFPGHFEHPFTIFGREYGGNNTICVDLDFDKMKDFGGYKIGVVGHMDEELPKNLRSRREFVTGVTRTLNAFYRTVNITPIYYDLDRSLPNDYLKEIPRALSKHIIYEPTYPYNYVPTHIITQFRGYKSQLTKILFVIDMDSRFGVVLVYLITLIFLKLFVHQALVPALLNLVRLTCNSGFPNLPNDTASRIYLGCLLFFVVTLQGIFQGDLASLLTTEISVRNVDTVQDLIDFGYKEIRGEKSLKLMLDELGYTNKFVAVNTPTDCLKGVKNDLFTACIYMSDGDLIDMVSEFNLHISRKPVFSQYVVFYFTWDWYFQQRLNTIISRIVEASVVESWETKCNPIKLSDFYVDPAVKNNVIYKNIELHEMQFAFVILYIGLACATIVFIIELAMVYRCRPVITVRKRPTGNI